MCGIAEGEALGNVIEDDIEAHRFREHGKLSADIAIADDAQGAASDLVCAVSGLVPDAAVKTRVLHSDASTQVDDLADGQFDHGTGVGVRGVEHADTQLGRRFQVDLIRSNAEGANCFELRVRFEHFTGDARLRTQAEVVDSLKSSDQFGLVEGSGVANDLDTVLHENFVGGLMGIFKEECSRHDRNGARKLVSTGNAFTF